MAQGNITKKDKVNIPDWVGTNLYLENDFVINDNRFYRANGDIPTGETTLTIGTAGATWTEMSPSAAESTPVRGYGTWALSETYDFAANGNTAGTAIRMPFEMEEHGTNTTFDATLNMFGLTGAPDNAPYVSIGFTAHISSDGDYAGTTTSGQIWFMIGFTDDLGTTWQVPVGVPVTRLFVHKAPDQVFLTHVMPDIEHVPGRKYALWARANDTIWRFIGGASGSYDFGMPGGGHAPLPATVVTISAFG